MDTPSATSAAFADAISAGDLDAAVACWLPDAVMVGADGTVRRGLAALSQAFAGLIATSAGVDIQVEQELATPSVAVAQTLMTITPPTPAEPLHVTGTVVYLATQHGWRIAIDRVHLARGELARSSGALATWLPEPHL